MLAALRPNIEAAMAAEISAERRSVLDDGVAFVVDSVSTNGRADLNFICTHNSRRSHLSHVWAHVAASMLELGSVQTYSGGTEATACNERTVASFKRLGFQIETKVGESSADNPQYLVSFSASHPPICVYSKVYTESPNPSMGFAAMMCCSDVDERCPVVQGAAVRIPLHYLDPKASDGTPDEAAVYDNRSREIAAEMFYLMGSAAERV